MRIEMETAGGFAPAAMAKRLSLDLSSLPEEARSRVQAAADEALQEPLPPPNPRMRDGRSHEIRITGGGKDETLVVYDGATPPAVSRLINLVKSLAKDA
jgi:hypothetical protein